MNQTAYLEKLQSEQFMEEVEYIKETRKKKKVVKPRQDKAVNLTLTDVHPLTEAQKQLFFAYKNNLNIVADGSAGTGKTFTATYLALESLFNKDIERVIFIRSAVNIRSQGHLPGTLDEKEAVYTIPFKAIVDELCGCGTAWETLVKHDMVKFMTTTFIRGVTLKNCIVIVDEFQSMDENEIYAVLTRLGENSRIILCGDSNQDDLKRKREQSCHSWVLNVASRMPNYFDVVSFKHHDIVRSDFVKALIMTVETI